VLPDPFADYQGGPAERGEGDGTFPDLLLQQDHQLQLEDTHDHGLGFPCSEAGAVPRGHAGEGQNRGVPARGPDPQRPDPIEELVLRCGPIEAEEFSRPVQLPADQGEGRDGTEEPRAIQQGASDSRVRAKQEAADNA